jgi:opacity protein-like surface antigen
LKKHDLIVALAAIAAAAASAPAFAQASAFPGEGWFIGGGLGQSHVSDSSSGGTVNGLHYSVSGLDENKTTAQVFGGYQFDETWGIQIQYTDLGKRSGTIHYNGASGSTGDVKANEWGIAGTATFPFYEQWFAKAKLGVSENHLDGFSTTVGGVKFSTGDNNHTDVLAGIGVGYQWTKNFSSRLEYEYYGKFETSGGNSSGKGSNIGLRMQYNF